MSIFPAPQGQTPTGSYEKAYRFTMLSTWALVLNICRRLRLEPFNPTTTSRVDLIKLPHYAAPRYPRTSPGGSACYQPVGRKAKVLPFPRLTWCPVMWKASWTNSRSFSRPFTTVFHAGDHA